MKESKRVLCIAANPENEVFSFKFIDGTDNDIELKSEETNDKLLQKVGYSGGVWGVIPEDNIVLGLLGFYEHYCLKKVRGEANGQGML